jgi:hypothetical protein
MPVRKFANVCTMDVPLPLAPPAPWFQVYEMEVLEGLRLRLEATEERRLKFAAMLPPEKEALALRDLRMDTDQAYFDAWLIANKPAKAIIMPKTSIIVNLRFPSEPGPRAWGPRAQFANDCLLAKTLGDFAGNFNFNQLGHRYDQYTATLSEEHRLFRAGVKRGFDDLLEKESLSIERRDAVFDRLDVARAALEKLEGGVEAYEALASSASTPIRVKEVKTGGKTTYIFNGRKKDPVFGLRPGPTWCSYSKKADAALTADIVLVAQGEKDWGKTNFGHVKGWCAALAGFGWPVLGPLPAGQGYTASAADDEEGGGRGGEEGGEEGEGGGDGEGAAPASATALKRSLCDACGDPYFYFCGCGGDGGGKEAAPPAAAAFGKAGDPAAGTAKKPRATKEGGGGAAAAGGEGAAPAAASASAAAAAAAAAFAPTFSVPPLHEAAAPVPPANYTLLAAGSPPVRLCTALLPGHPLQLALAARSESYDVEEEGYADFFGRMAALPGVGPELCAALLSPHTYAWAERGGVWTAYQVSDLRIAEGGELEYQARRQGAKTGWLRAGLLRLGVSVQ